MKKLLNKLKELYKKSSLFRIVVILLIWALIIFEWKNIYVDRYNFQQLEKAKKVVEKFEKSWKRLALPVYSLDDFNYWKWTDFLVWMWADIEPLDKRYCYDVYYDKNPTWPWYVFEFWFKLHSLLYKLRYGWEYYNYPHKKIEPKESEECKKAKKATSNLPWIKWIPPVCVWWTYYYRYMRIVNNPCER